MNIVGFYNKNKANSETLIMHIKSSLNMSDDIHEWSQDSVYVFASMDNNPNTQIIDTGHSFFMESHLRRIPQKLSRLKLLSIAARHVSILYQIIGVIMFYLQKILRVIH